MARKAIEIDLNLVEQYAGEGLSEAEICDCLGISVPTLERRKKDSEDFVSALKRGKSNAKRMVANKLFEKCKDGDLGAIIWFEKTRSGFTDKTEQNHTGQIKIAVTYDNPHPDASEPS